MTPLQEKEYRLLSLLLDVCREEGLTCYLVCGSALGAVKYGGFIPWDDDVDVALPRGDYERFLTAAPRYLPPDVFLQTGATDPHYPHLFAKLRDSGTTFIEPAARDLDMNHGIYIDVFPLDGAPDDERAVRRLEAKKKRFLRRIGTVFSVDRRGPSFCLWLFHVLIGDRKRTQTLLRKLNKLITQYPADTSPCLVNHGNWQGLLEYAPRDWFAEGTDALFEGLPVRVPKAYDAYLTRKYGDWRKDPPPERQVSHHAPLAVSTDVPYTAFREGAGKGGRP